MSFPEQNDGGNTVGAVDASPLDDGHTSAAPAMSEEDYQAYLGLVPEDAIIVPKKPEYKWQDDLIMVERKNKATGETFLVPSPSAQQNIYLMTRYVEQLRGMFILNEFSQRRMMVKCPPWMPENKFLPRDIHDDDYTRVMMELEKLGMKPTPAKCMLAIESICRDRSFHPVRRYFKKLKWDGTERLHRWLTYYLGAEKDDLAYLSAIGIRWLVAGVARIFNPGCKFDHMLVLEGQTDIGKSKALRLLSTFNGVPYFNDSLTFETLFDKDTILNIQGSLIVEFPEMTGITKRDSNEIKQWITIQEDRGRPPYGKAIIVYPRQFILAGTTNDDAYLIDSTGNKRFWPVACGSRIDFEALAADKEQLWAEAVHLYESGYKWWVDDNDHELIRLCREAQKNRMVTHPWESAVLEYISGRKTITASEILIKAIEMPLKQVRKGDEMIVTGILKMNGWTQGRDKNGRCWIAPRSELV